MSALLKGLNEVQKQAAMHADGPLVVFAGAGSGKTRIITHRIAMLIERGVNPWEILAVTFTNKAAAEMRERVGKLHQEANRAHISTFHSSCARWLREFAVHLGFRTDFTIYDDSDATSALKKIVKDMFKNIELAPYVSDMRTFLHDAKMYGLLPAEVEQSHYFDSRKIPQGAVEVYKRYQEYLHACQAMDFSDLILNMLLLLRRNTQVADVLSKRYKYILVDEFQDTNPSQMELIERLAGQHKNLFVVGDDDQSIYSWRGASPANLINFQDKYPGAKRITMAENYRSAQNIIAAANAVIAHNKYRVEKELYSKVPAGPPILYRFESDGEMEAWYVVDMLKQELNDFHYSDFAIFYRTNAQSRLIEEALRRENIPYRIFGAMKFYERLEVRDILAYLRLFVNEDDDVSLRRIVNVPTRGIGQKAMEGLEALATSKGQSILKTMRELAEDSRSRQGMKFAIFMTLFETLKEQVLQSSLGEAVSILMEGLDYQAYLQKKHADTYVEKIENLHELASGMGEFAKRNTEATLADWLQTITLVREDADTDNEGEEGVSLMTLHTAKGLEFPRVFLVGVEEGLIPHRNSKDDKAAIEEERRLFYVGMTRAKERLTLVSAGTRMVYSQFMANEPSQFLKEIPPDLLVVEGAETNSPSSSSHDPMYTSDDDVSYDYLDEGYTCGSKVRHPSYGKGVIESLEEQFGRPKAVVRFHEFGVRKVSLSQLQRS